MHDWYVNINKVQHGIIKVSECYSINIYIVLMFENMSKSEIFLYKSKNDSYLKCYYKNVNGS